MRLAVIGSGYVGLVSGVCLAARGHDVTGVDVNPDVVATINAGRPHIHERDLPELLGRVIAEGRFRATTTLADAIQQAELVLVAVGTPSVDGRIDLRWVREAVRSIAAAVSGSPRHLSIVIKSTVLPGTTDTVVRGDLEAAGLTDGRIGLGMNPEFLREGEAVGDFMHPDRIVLGFEDDQTLARLRQLYQPWSCDKLEVNTRTAEFIKYASNALLATQISAVNELAALAGALGGVDVLDVMKGVHLDGRWNPVAGGQRVNPGILRYLIPGCGFGGSCFPKDVQALRAQGVDLGIPMEMLSAVLGVNERQPGLVAAGLTAEVPDLGTRSCLVLGLAFKPGTDDVRESASLPIVRDLRTRVGRLSVHDPVAAGNFRTTLAEDADGVTFVSDWKRAAEEADVVVIATAWDDYRELPSLDLTGKVIFDARRLLDPADLPGCRYLSIGRRLPAARC